MEDTFEKEQNPTRTAINHFDVGMGNSLVPEMDLHEPFSEEKLSSEIVEFQNVDYQVDPSIQTKLSTQQLNEISQALVGKFSSVESQMNRLMRDFQTKLKVDEQKDQTIDHLHRGELRYL